MPKKEATKVKVVKWDRTVATSKRQTLPFSLIWSCPECDKNHEEDLTVPKSYNGHLNGTFEFFLYCDNCGYEETVLLRTHIDLEVVGQEDPQITSQKGIKKPPFGYFYELKKNTRRTDV